MIGGLTSAQTAAKPVESELSIHSFVFSSGPSRTRRTLPINSAMTGMKIDYKKYDQMLMNKTIGGMNAL